VLRHNGTYPEDEVAEKLGFHSAETMQIQLRNWGLPDWLIEAKVVEDQAPATGAKPSVRLKGQNKKRAARSSYGEGQILPAADRAANIFARDIESLEWFLTTLDQQFTEQLHEGKRFLSYSRIEEDSDHYHRSSFSEQQWEELCEEWNVDPSAEEFYLPLKPSVYPHGARDTPWRGLAILIGVHALIHPTVDRLIEALHPNPSSVDWKELYDQKGKDSAKGDGIVTTLKGAAGRLARVVRGGKVRRGVRDGVVPHYEHQLAWRWIIPLAREGYSDKEIYRKLKEDGPLDPDGRYWLRHYSIEDVKRLRNLLPPPPNQEPGV